MAGVEIDADRLADRVAQSEEGAYAVDILVAVQFEAELPDAEAAGISDKLHFVARINIRAHSGPRSDIYVRRTYPGRPSSSIRFSEATAIATSVICRPLVRERSASPITRL